MDIGSPDRQTSFERVKSMKRQDNMNDVLKWADGDEVQINHKVKNAMDP